NLVNSMGVDYLREELSYKDKNDFRIETVLGMLDRYGVTEGSIEKQNLSLITGLPDELMDENYLKEKLKNDNMKLLSVVNYFKTEECRRVFISEYFGFTDEPPCGNCDYCN
ncbi:MAG: RecQ family zinc-binding domain-containing protein, partial [Ignavibacteriaceae bacterium]|nr:RecQ family zinc-binding domain-containing protein [Ignavibacteriaceae bacterium]